MPLLVKKRFKIKKDWSCSAETLSEEKRFSQVSIRFQRRAVPGSILNVAPTEQFEAAKFDLSRVVNGRIMRLYFTEVYLALITILKLTEVLLV